MAFESAEQRRVNGRASRAEQSMVRARAATAGSEDPPSTAPTEKAYLGSDGMAVAPASAPAEVRAIIEAGNAIATKPYKYGGGHARWNDSGYDCSGSVSYVLHAAGLLSRPLVSGLLASRWGLPGTGSWITVYANRSHTYAMIAGLRFDTSAVGESVRQGSGPRWRTTIRSPLGYAAKYYPGY
jgi:hypothetical protein